MIRRPNKTSVHMNIDKEILSKARDMIYWMPGVLIGDFVEDLLAKSIAEYEEKHGEIDRQEDLYFKVPKKS